MKSTKLLNADFEQSLNLLDDVLVKSYKEWWDENHIKKKFGIIAKTIGYLALLFIIWMPSAISKYYYRHPKAYTMKINFYPSWLCWLIMIVFLVLMFIQVYGKGKNCKYMEFYNSQLRSFWYCLALMVACNLFVATVITPIVTIYGTVGGYAIITTFLVMIYRKKVREIKAELYDLQMEQGHKKRRFNKLLNFKVLIKIGVVILAVYYIYKFIFWSSGSTVTPPLVIGAATGWNILTILVIFYLFFPCVIEGYYRNKYAEEYRDWEGKTQMEWYGEKYFNKHIKGTEKEEKTQ